MIQSFIAIGDSFTEGLGDHWPDGQPRGWADRLAHALALNNQTKKVSSPFLYANLALRGRKLERLLAEQLDVAIDLNPDLISLNGGGNDMLRPNFSLQESNAILKAAVEKIRAANIRVLLLAGPNPARHLPMGWVFGRRGSAFVDRSARWAKDMGGLTYCDNFNDTRIMRPEYWSPDGLHLGSAGHMQVTINCLRALKIPVPEGWDAEELLLAEPHDFASFAYYKHYVTPWIGRRIRGESSGDGRTAKRPGLLPVVP